MPEHLFSGALYLDHSTAIRGNPDKQNFSVCPRHWYIEADFKCESCGREFTWTTGEQKAWFEDYFFWIDSSPRRCRGCMADCTRLAELRKEYDSCVASARDHGTTEEKRRVIEIVSELEMALAKLPEKISATRALFERQLEARKG